jgi:hypothetical protein
VRFGVPPSGFQSWRRAEQLVEIAFGAFGDTGPRLYRRQAEVALASSLRERAALPASGRLHLSKALREVRVDLPGHLLDVRLESFDLQEIDKGYRLQDALHTEAREHRRAKCGGMKHASTRLCLLST